MIHLPEMRCQFCGHKGLTMDMSSGVVTCPECSASWRDENLRNRVMKGIEPYEEINGDENEAGQT